MRSENLVGKRFGKILITEHYYRKNKKGYNVQYVKGVCDCGNNVDIYKQSLFGKHPTVSCGCRLKEIHTYGTRTTHGMSDTSLYNRWLGMFGRCYNKNNKKYKNYGARGIIVCDEWKNSFQNFYDWSMKNGFNESLTLDRIDVDGNYCPENCRWTDMFTQENNRTNNRKVVYNKKEYSLLELSKISVVDYKTLHQRLFRYNWDVEKAINTPSRIKKKTNKKGENKYETR